MDTDSSASSRYSRNGIYISGALQERIRGTRVLLAGAGLGSVIAECLLRTGFENITLADGDLVELSNLNRQNYTEGDIGKNKAAAIARRLTAIHSGARISAAEFFLDKENIPEFVQNADLIVNAIDFENDAHIFLDRVATRAGKTTILPLNLGFGALAAVFGPGCPELSSLLGGEAQSYPVAILNALRVKPTWLIEAFEKYVFQRDKQGYDPQLAIGASLTAGLASSLCTALVHGDPIRFFPEWYFLDTRSPYADR